MHTIRFKLAIPATDYLHYYKGLARNISVTGNDGRRIEFPAEHLRPFVTHAGIQGEFELSFDTQQKFVALRRID